MNAGHIIACTCVRVEAKKKSKLGDTWLAPAEDSGCMSRAIKNHARNRGSFRGIDVHPSYREMMELSPGVEFAAQ